jgi:hypothetical protein
MPAVSTQTGSLVAFLSHHNWFLIGLTHASCREAGSQALLVLVNSNSLQAFTCWWLCFPKIFS